MNRAWRAESRAARGKTRLRMQYPPRISCALAPSNGHTQSSPARSMNLTHRDLELHASQAGQEPPLRVLCAERRFAAARASRRGNALVTRLQHLDLTRFAVDSVRSVAVSFAPPPFSIQITPDERPNRTDRFVR
jgi:hypothetical protein